MFLPSEGNFLADCRSRLVAVDIVCPGFVDIHTHGIGGHEGLIQEIKSCHYFGTSDQHYYLPPLS